MHSHARDRFHRFKNTISKAKDERNKHRNTIEKGKKCQKAKERNLVGWASGDAGWDKCAPSRVFIIFGRHQKYILHNSKNCMKRKAFYGVPCVRIHYLNEISIPRVRRAAWEYSDYVCMYDDWHLSSGTVILEHDNAVLFHFPFGSREKRLMTVIAFFPIDRDTTWKYKIQNRLRPPLPH